MKPKGRFTLGIDCGGTNLKLALVEPGGGLVRSQGVPVNFKEPPPAVVKKIASDIRKFLKSARVAKVAAIGMGIAGDVDPSSGMVRFSPNLGWRDVPLKALLSKEIKIPVLVENDANCAAWGAYCLDAAKDCKNLICLTLGTGIGGGIILGGKLYRGASGSAGEIGHMTVEMNGRACRCGNYGCIESLVGSWGLIEIAESALKQDRAPVLRRLLQKYDLSPKTMELAASQGDPFCLQLWKDAGAALGCALSNLVNIFNPDRIILCGGLSKAGKWLLEPALHALGRRAFKTPATHVRVSISKFDDRLGVVGAAFLARE